MKFGLYGRKSAINCILSAKRLPVKALALQISMKTIPGAYGRLY